MSLPYVASPFYFDNRYAALGEVFAVPTLPTPVKRPHFIGFNLALAQAMGGQDGVDWPSLLPCFAGNALMVGMEPVAQVYAGHQFGHFNPRLGDGRAILLGEVIGREGKRYDVQLKGAGLTPFSRSGDGRAALGPVMREYLVSEAMHALGIATTRALAAVSTGQPVYRETALPGAVLTRVAASHIRIGTFEYFARRGDVAAVKTLADHVIHRHYPECLTAPNAYVALFDAVMAAQIALVSRWLAVGFIHGVMNTDNMSICGETIDYGPCAFMDAYDPATAYSAIDTHGRYAFGNQKAILQWNLARFAECLLRLMAEDIEVAVAHAEQRLSAFNAEFEAVYYALMASKMGVQNMTEAGVLVDDLLALMAAQQADYTLVWRSLGNVLLQGSGAPFVSLFNEPAPAGAWLDRWQVALAAQGANALALGKTLQTINPAVIARNYQVEAVIAEGLAMVGDCPSAYPAFEALLKVVQDPFNARYEASPYARPALLSQQRAYQTFCGT